MIKYYANFDELDRHEIKASDLEIGQILITDNEVAKVVEGPRDSEGYIIELIGQSWDGSMFGPMQVLLKNDDTVDVIFPTNSRHARGFRELVEKRTKK